MYFKFDIYLYVSDVEVDHPLVNPQVKSRELFCSEAIDTYPVTALRYVCVHIVL